MNLHSAHGFTGISAPLTLIRNSIQRFARRLAYASIDRPYIALATIGLLTMLGALGIPNLRLSIDGNALTPWGDPSIIQDSKLRREFLLGDPVVILIDTGRPDGIFDFDLLSMVRD